MQIYRNMDELILSDKPKTIVLGNFDGVHLGHQKLISMAKSISSGIEGETFVFTFFPHPQFVFNNNFKMLNSFELKARLIEKLGIEYLVAIPFTEEIFKLSPEQFVEKILYKKFKVSHVVAGFNYSFGYKGQGKAQDLVELTNNFDIQTTIMEPFYINKELVSSSRIRRYLKIGQIKNAAKLLGYAPRIKGKVVKGEQIGREIGFPTANLDWDKNILIPQAGVYAVQVLVNGELKQGVLNIGLKPTVAKQNKLTMEVNILDFTREIYNDDIEVIFYKKLRDEIKFNTLNDLKSQIKLDVAYTRKFFSEYF